MSARATGAQHRGSPVRSRRLVRAAVLPVALLISAGTIWQASYAAFTTSTSSPDNSWASANLELQNDTSGSFAKVGVHMFQKTAVVPGDSGIWCVNVKNNSDFDASAGKPLTFYATGVPANDLATTLTLKIEDGTGATGGGSGDCASFAAGSTIFDSTLDQLPATFSASAITQATFAKAAVKSYRFTWELPAGASTASQGKTVTGVEFVWAMSVG